MGIGPWGKVKAGPVGESPSNDLLPLSVRKRHPRVEVLPDLEVGEVGAVLGPVGLVGLLPAIDEDGAIPSVPRDVA
jgi:hypothetical protein